MLEKLAKDDSKWRQIALMITSGHKDIADDIVNEMYLRRYDNDRGQPITDYYVILTMKSIFLNQKKTNRLINVEEVRNINIIERYEITDQDKELLDRYNNLSFTEKELIELSYDHSLRDIQKKYGINYGYAHNVITKARKKVLQNRINEYNNKRLKHMKSKGLGDTIEKITKATGIKKLVDKMNIDCGCDERKEYLNRIFAYKLKPRCMTKEELQAYGDFVRDRTFQILTNSTASGSMTNQEIMFLVDTYNSIFSVQTEYPKCRSCNGTAKMLITMVNNLDTVYLNNIPEQKKPGRKPKVEVKEVE